MKTKSLFLLFLVALLAITPMVVGATEETADPEYITVAQPVTNIWGDISAVVRIESQNELSAVAAKEKMPAIAIFDVDASLNILDESGTAFSTVYGVIEALNFNVIPVYYVENAEEAAAVASYLAEEFTDAFIMSDDLAVLKAAKTACPLISLVADYTDRTSFTAADYEAIRSDFYNNSTTVIMINGDICTKEVASSLKEKRLLVWAEISDTPTKTEVFGAVNSGAVAVVSDDSDAVIDVACSLAENTMTRVPYIQAHRGYTSNGYYIENTKESIINAYLKGAKTMEYDIHLSAPEEDDPGDGSTRKLVLYHDGVTKTADTIDGVQYDISETPWSVLYEKVLYTSEHGYEYRLSHLEEAFEYLSAEKKNNGGVLDLRMAIEIKPGSDVIIVDHLLALIEKYDLFEQSMITTFSMSYINRAKELNPALPTNYLQSSSVIFDTTAEENINAVRELIGPTGSSYSPSAYYGGKVDIGPVTMRTLLRRGYLANYWGLGTSPENYLYYGLLGIGTDYLENCDPIVFGVSPTGLNDELKVPAGRTVEIGAVIDKRIELDVPTADFEIMIIEGEELVENIDGGKITFAEGSGEVSFAVSYNYKEGKIDYIIYSEPVTVTVTNEVVFEGGVSMEGYSIRLQDYNGLRGLFAFDKGYSKRIENELGYTLVEFGAIAMPEAAYISNGKKATLDSETLALTTKGYKAPIWSGGKYVNKILEDKDGVISYCLSVIDFETRFNENLYFCAYSVYTAPSGETVISYADYSYPEYRLINLYQTTLDMFVNGAVNSSNTDDAAVWNTLLTGAVVLERDTHFVDTYTYSETEVAVKDMSGNAFGDTFTFSEIAAIGDSKTTASTTVNITLLNDPSSGNWVAVYRGEGSIPGNAWNIKNQLDSARGANLITSTDDLLSPNPLLTSAAEAKIKTVILDSGITGTGVYPFMNLDFTTLVYADSFTSISHSLFYNCVNVTTAYEAKAMGEIQKNEVGLADFSGVETINTQAMFRQVRGVSKVHLPSSVTSLANDFFFDDWSRNRTFALKVWCGDTAEPENGVVDLTGAAVTSIGTRAFYQLSTLKTLILPDSCTSIGKTAFTAHSSGTSLDTVKQATYNSAIAEYCATNSFEYTNLSGTVHNATEQ